MRPFFFLQKRKRYWIAVLIFFPFLIYVVIISVQSSLPIHWLKELPLSCLSLKFFCQLKLDFVDFCEPYKPQMHQSFSIQSINKCTVFKLCYFL